jgi:hypothetical protein
MELRRLDVGEITNATVDDTTVKDLATRLRGELIRPGDDGYDAARRIHNGMIDRRPALILRCAGVADVVAGIRFARGHDLLLSIRGGGHSVPGFSVCDGGLMLDLSRMKSVQVDPVRQIARAEGGATWGDFDHETQAFGLATTGGVARPTGIAGLTLGGGHGFLMRRFGLAADNLLTVNLVTAEGKLVSASAEENPELFWGLRGGGGNFGVATSFTYRLHQLGPILGGLIIYPMNRAREFLRLYRDVTATAPDELGTIAALATLPDGTPASALICGYSGPIEDGERLLRPFRQLGPPLVDQLGPMPYVALQSIAEHFNPPGMRNYWKSSYLGGLGDAAIDALVDGYASVPAPLTHIVIENLGGAVSRVGPEDTACGERDKPYNAVVIGMWADAADDEKNVRWVRGQWQALQPFASDGVYVNYLSGDEAGRIRSAYGPETHARLVALKKAYDPANLFRLNQNIPAG